MQRRRAAAEDATSTDLLYRIAPMGLPLPLAIAVVFALLVWPPVAQPPLIAWVVAAGALSALRLSRISRYLTTLPGHAEQPRWRREFVALAVLSGLLWGSAAFLFFPEGQPLYHTFTMVMLCGIAAAAVATTAADALCYRLYLFCVLGPLVVRLVTLGGQVNLSLAFLVAFFMLALEMLSGWVGRLTQEIHQVKQGDRYQRDVMEMLAKGAPLSRVLHAIVRGVGGPDRGVVARTAVPRPQRSPLRPQRRACPLPRQP